MKIRRVSLTRALIQAFQNDLLARKWRTALAKKR